jgi:hypothetical protein
LDFKEKLIVVKFSKEFEEKLFKKIMKKAKNEEFIAIWTAEGTKQAKRGILSIEQINPNTIYNSTLPYEQLFIDEEVLAGMLSMGFIVLIFAVVVLAITNIEIAPHLTDSFETSIKKNQ